MPVLLTEKTAVRPAVRALHLRELRRGVWQPLRGGSLDLRGSTVLPLRAGDAERDRREDPAADGRCGGLVHRRRGHARHRAPGGDEAAAGPSWADTAPEVHHGELRGERGSVPSRNRRDRERAHVAQV